MIFGLRVLLDAKSPEKNGFSLIELVTAISVLAVLSTLASLNIVCFIKDAKARAALERMRQIQVECLSKTLQGREAFFRETYLSDYSIRSGNNNSCDGVGPEKTIAAVPINTDELPTFILSVSRNKLTYDFRGEFGENLNDCLGLICQYTIRSGSSKDSKSSAKKHDPYSDPFHGDRCKFRSSMFYADQGFGGKLITGCYDEDNKFLKDPCALTQIGCENYSFTGYNTNPLNGKRSTAGNYPCIPGRKSYFYRVPEGWDPVASSSCEDKAFVKPFTDLDSTWCQRSAACRNFDFSGTPLYSTDDPPLEDSGKMEKDVAKNDKPLEENGSDQNKSSEGNWRNCYCFPPKDPCLCDDGLPSGPR